jgi:hypothetical protein
MAYNKTTWENAPSTNTPINANNLNKIEEGIYQNSLKADQEGDLSTLDTTTKSTLVGAINELVPTKDLIPVVLYNDSTGSTTTVSLSDSINNYSYIEIFYHIGTGTTGGYVKVIPNEDKKIELFGTENDGGNCYRRMANITFDSAGTTGTLSDKYQEYFNGTKRYYTAMATAITIIKILGIK